MVAILQDLHEEDHFGILVFERKISYWKDYLTKATKRNVSDAIDYVKKIQDSGSKYCWILCTVIFFFFILLIICIIEWVKNGKILGHWQLHNKAGIILLCYCYIAKTSNFVKFWVWGCH